MVEGTNQKKDLISPLICPRVSTSTLSEDLSFCSSKLMEMSPIEKLNSDFPSWTIPVSFSTITVLSNYMLGSISGISKSR